MPVLKFYDTVTGSWRRVGGEQFTGAGYVPLTGGTVAGDLRVRGGFPYEAMLQVEGNVAAGDVILDGGGSLNMGIILSPGLRTVTLNGLRGRRVGNPAADDSVATKRYMAESARQAPEPVALELLQGWVAAGQRYATPRCRLSGNGTMVYLEGSVKTAVDVRPDPLPVKPLLVLPEAFRPSREVVLTTVGQGESLYTLHVAETGAVWVATGRSLLPGSVVSLDNCRYQAG